jgi:hypothetical protein
MLTEEWSLDASYRYRFQDRNGDDADSNGVFLALNFKPLSEF